MNGQLFRLHLTGSGDFRQLEHLLRRVVSPAGHDVRLELDEEGRCSLTVLIRSRRPAGELERLMRQAGLWGYFVPLREW